MRRSARTARRGMLASTSAPARRTISAISASTAGPPRAVNRSGARRALISVSAAAAQDGRDGLGEDADLVDRPCAIDVVDVELDLLLERQIAAPADLPEA